jgi:hypothetical protein
MYPAHITVTSKGVVREVVYALQATGFYPAPRADIKPGDVLTQDEKIQIGLQPEPEGYVPPVTEKPVQVMISETFTPDPSPPPPPVHPAQPASPTA